MPLLRLSKRAYRKGALFVFLGLLFATSSRAQTLCPADHIDEQVRVSKIYDGDTVKLEDGRKVRFIGINAPEIGRDGKPSEPFAQKARQRLIQLLDDNRVIGLRYGQERRDHYGRLLAHPYLKDGRSINALLLSDGLAAHIVVPPNSWNYQCYGEVERSARQISKGIWQTSRFRPHSSHTLPLSTRGFHLVQGRVERIGRSRKSLWLNLEGDVALRVPRNSLDNFTQYRVESLAGMNVVARGWVNYHRDKLVIIIRHPASLELIDWK